jgi:hypothetical protein
MSIHTFGAAADSAEPTANTTRPIWKTRRRPLRSARRPDTRSRLARPMKKTEATHETVL